jgi:hypothetical protein
MSPLALIRPSHPVRHLLPLRNHRFFCSRFALRAGKNRRTIEGLTTKKREPDGLALKALGRSTLEALLSIS